MKEAKVIFLPPNFKIFAVGLWPGFEMGFLFVWLVFALSWSVTP
jgi:hypothetical protein